MRFVAPDLDDPMSYPKSVRRAVAQRRDAVWKESEEHHARIRPKLPVGLRFLCEFSIDDAPIRSLKIDCMEKTVRLKMIVGDLQRGYFDLDITYLGISLTRNETNLLCLIAHAADDAIWGELDVLEENGQTVFVHRIRWHSSIQTGVWKYGSYNLVPEFEFRFTGAKVRRRKREAWRPRRRKQWIEVVRDPNIIEGLDEEFL